LKEGLAFTDAPLFIAAMKKLCASFLVLTCFLSSLFADKPIGDPMVKHVNAKEAGELWKANKANEGFIVLDVRTAEENEEVRIPNAMNLDVKGSGFTAKTSKLDKERTYLVHCRSGGRSKTAMKALQKLGFLKLYHLDGGMMAWEKEGLQVEKGK
jgi:rhodanese-related sulfurtransferase